MSLNWRDCDAWSKNEKIRMNTTSNEACKLYDCALTQYVTWKEIDQDDGGLEKTVDSMIAADSDFFLGHVLKNGLDLIGSSSVPNHASIQNLTQLKNKHEKSLSEHELCHYDAILDLYNGNLKRACSQWENILVEHPNDMMALKFAHDIYFYLGWHAQMRDSVARVLPVWKLHKRDDHLYSYLYGMYSFGLVQSNYFEEANQAALKSLEMNKHDAWATHTVCHYYEYRVRAGESIEFLRKTEQDWSSCNLLAAHNYWHLCLQHLERNEHEQALEIFDNNMLKWLNLNRTLDLVDLVSLLYRLKLDSCEVDLSERWSLLYDAYKSRFQDHGYLYNDFHIAMILSNSKSEDNKSKFLDSFNNFVKRDDDEINNNHVSPNYLKQINKELGENVFNTIFEFDQGNYERVVDILYPIRYDLIKMGGSNAQRDLFPQILLQSALKSQSKRHQILGVALLNERQALKPGSRLTERIKARFAPKHLLD
jgi:hypothetical protein